MKLQSDSLHQNPVIYHVLTDRFAVTRVPASPTDVAAFLGGRLAGITAKIREGWFSDLGVNAIWISAPYEQIRGWVAGTGAQFRHYAYHGYWALDYTVVDPRIGTTEELKDLIDTAHQFGIRVVFDIVISHPGYPDLQTVNDLLPTALRPGWQQALPSDYTGFMDLSYPACSDWWGPDWVRADIEGYDPGGQDELTACYHGLPRFKTEHDNAVTPPAFLLNKADSRVRLLKNTSVRGYLITWLTEWVRRFGVDGFRCDSARHVSPATWLALKDAASAALNEWKSRNPELAIDDAPFWMCGEMYGAGIERSGDHDTFDSTINFDFQHQLRLIYLHADKANAYSRSLTNFRLDRLYTRYAAELADTKRHGVTSYISSHDTYMFDRVSLHEAATALMLAPGGIQLFYGDETGRAPWPENCADPVQATRGPMNWDSVDYQLLLHWQRLGQFRQRHVAIARGVHQRISEDPYVFSRTDVHSGDRVIAVVGHSGRLRVDISGVFPDVSWLRDGYSGRILAVHEGQVEADMEGILLLEQLDASFMADELGA